MSADSQEFSFKSESFQKNWSKFKAHIVDESLEEHSGGNEFTNPYLKLMEFVNGFDVQKFESCKYCLELPVLNLEKSINK
ncbi:hypothetical protein, partial [Acinetobacter stercoris]|uniref:hypothetical protein n=1 Tax=Acinetobacter stercoris TaxID=2126983 RepID=UPI0011B1F651